MPQLKVSQVQKLTELYEVALELLAEKPEGEEYHDDYKKHDDLWKMVLRSDHLTEKLVYDVFKEYAGNVNSLVNWSEIMQKVEEKSASVLEPYNSVVWQEFNIQLGIAIAKGIAEALSGGGKFTEREIGYDVEWSSTHEEAVKWLNKYPLDLVKKVNETTRKRMAAQIKAGITYGETQDQIRDRLIGVIKDRERAATIAHTETIRAYGQGRVQAAMLIPAKRRFKTWRTTINPCAVCISKADIGKISLDDTFDGTDTPPAHPRCRCTIKIEIEE